MKSKLLIFSFFLLIGFGFTHAQDKQSPLDGKKYKIELIKEGKTESVDTVAFMNSMFQTPTFQQHGFTQGIAYVKPTKDYFTWGSTLKSDKEGVMAWQGSVTGDKIEGTFTWRKSGQISVTYKFTGTEIGN